MRDEYVSREELRDRFNTSGFVERAMAGTLTKVLAAESHPSPVRSHQPDCTRSQMIEYWDADRLVAKVHQYLRPDGTIGASGKPDPKVLVIDNVRFRERPSAISKASKRSS